MEAPFRIPHHPGEILGDSLTEAGITRGEAGGLLGVSRSTVQRIIAGRTPVTAELAVRLEANGFSTAEQWLRVQAAHDLARARAGVA